MRNRSIARGLAGSLVAGSWLALLSSLPAPVARAGDITVTTTIQAAVDAANPGDTVHVPPGTYHENVRVSKDNITIEGSAGAILDGAGLEGDTGILVESTDPAGRITGFHLTGMQIQNFSENGVKLDRVDTFEIDHGTYTDNAEYGIYPVHSTNGSVTFNTASGSNDTGVYIGQSDTVTLEMNQAMDNTVGIEVENSSNITVEKNICTNNTVGILVVVLPLLDVKVTSNVTISNNKLKKNNRPNPVTDPTDELSAFPSGVGFANIGGDNVQVEANKASHNNSAGFAMVSLPDALASLDPLIDPKPDGNTFERNKGTTNGKSPDPKLSPLPGADLLWDVSGTGNCFSKNRFKSTFPSPLPKCS